MREVAVKIEAAATKGVLHAVVTVLVVHPAFLFIREHFVGFRSFLKLLFRLLIALIAVRMILHGQLAVGLLNGFGIGRFLYPEHLVIVALRRHLA